MKNKIKWPKLIGLTLFLAFTLGTSLLSGANFFMLLVGMRGMSLGSQIQIALVYSFCTSALLSIAVLLLTAYVLWISRARLEVKKE